jgi:hypothetical protein
VLSTDRLYTLKTTSLKHFAARDKLRKKRTFEFGLSIHGAMLNVLYKSFYLFPYSGTVFHGMEIHEATNEAGLTNFRILDISRLRIRIQHSKKVLIRMPLFIKKYVQLFFLSFLFALAFKKLSFF